MILRNSKKKKRKKEKKRKAESIFCVTRKSWYLLRYLKLRKKYNTKKKYMGA